MTHNPSTSNPVLAITNATGGRTYQWLKNGKPGSVQTMREMKRIVRADLGLDGRRRDRGLYDFAHLILDTAKVPGHDWQGEIATLLRYAQLITYRRDPAGGGDDIADARIPIKEGWGDCDDLAVTLSTLLGMVGYSSSFKAVRYDESTAGFQHVYVVAETPEGPLFLDPTNPQAIPGWEKAGIIDSVSLPIFSTDERLGLGDLSQLINSISGAVNTGINAYNSTRTAGAGGGNQDAGKQFDVADKALAAYYGQLRSQLQITLEQYQAALGGLQALGDFAAQNPGSPYVQSQWAMESPLYQAALPGLQAKIGSVEVLPPGTISDPATQVALAGPGIIENLLAQAQAQPLIAVGVIISGALLLKTVLGKRE